MIKKIEKNLKREKKKIIRDTIISLSLFILILSFVGFVIGDDSETWPAFNVCCEKTDYGAWCQNTQEENCNEGYRKTPTSCDATSFCKLGCCVDTEEGLCMKNTPLKVCEVSSGTWLEDEECNVPQCDLGCCLLGNQASFITLTRCKKLSRVYGLETNFKPDVVNEAECILMANAQDKGACIFELDGEKFCKQTTRVECSSSGEREGNITGETEFKKDYLCSADKLGTICGPSTETTCVEGKDEVYFKDTCGNPANIYDANRVYSKDSSYWQKIVYKSDSCGYGNGNINSKSCGNCEYLEGSICGSGDSTYGDYNCRDLNCYKTQNGENYRNGESWCEFAGGERDNGLDPAGSRYFRHLCIHGEEVIEPCADFRNDVCIEEEFGPEYGNFREAACRPNRWTDCINQFTEEDCLNEDKRDCYWVKGVHYDGSKSQGEVQSLASQNSEKTSSGIIGGGYICLPNNPPGLEFWGEGNAKSVCSLGNSVQNVKFVKGIIGDKKCKENCGVLETSWIDTMNRVCISLGDCGAHVNFMGAYTDYGLAWKQNGVRKNIQTGMLYNIESEVYDAEVASEEITPSEEFSEINEGSESENTFNAGGDEFGGE